MRGLAEQIHGLKVDSRTTVIDLVTQTILLELWYKEQSEVQKLLELILPVMTTMKLFRN